MYNIHMRTRLCEEVILTNDESDEITTNFGKLNLKKRIKKSLQ